MCSSNTSMEPLRVLNYLFMLLSTSAIACCMCLATPPNGINLLSPMKRHGGGFFSTFTYLLKVLSSYSGPGSAYDISGFHWHYSTPII